MIIGLSGYARSGKDTIAEHLVEKYGFVRVSFADPMREALYRLNPMISVHDMTHVPLASAVDGMGWEEVKKASADLRGLLQRMGTEVGRNMFGESFWVDQAFSKIQSGANVVVSDVRFKNEADAIRSLDGVMWRVVREGTGPANGHVSESELDEYPVNDVIVNAGSIEELLTLVNNRMQTLVVTGLL